MTLVSLCRSTVSPLSCSDRAKQPLAVFAFNIFIRLNAKREVFVIHKRQIKGFHFKDLMVLVLTFRRKFFIQKTLEILAHFKLFRLVQLNVYDSSIDHIDFGVISV